MERRDPERSRSRSLGLGAELAALLLVLACLGGSLALVVTVHRRQAGRREAPKPAEPTPVAVRPTPPPPKAPEPEPEPEPVEDPTPKALAEIAGRIADERRATEEADRTAASRDEARRSALAASARWRRRERLIRSQVADLEDRAHRLEAESDELARERDALVMEREATKQDLERARLRAGAANSFAILPYRGTNGTWRRPIPIECRDGSATLMPNGPTYTMLDLSTALGMTRNHPLVLAVAMALARAERAPSPDGAPVVPYVLFLIRPDGIRAYYEARARLEPLGIAFGYELADPDWEFDYSSLDDAGSWPTGAKPGALASDPPRSAWPGAGADRPVGDDPTRNIWRSRPGEGDGPPGGGGFEGDPFAGLGRSSRGAGPNVAALDPDEIVDPPGSFGQGRGAGAGGRPGLPRLEPVPSGALPPIDPQEGSGDAQGRAGAPGTDSSYVPSPRRGAARGGSGNSEGLRGPMAGRPTTPLSPPGRGAGGEGTDGGQGARTSGGSPSFAPPPHPNPLPGRERGPDPSVTSSGIGSGARSPLSPAGRGAGGEGADSRSIARAFGGSASFARPAPAGRLPGGISGTETSGAWRQAGSGSSSPPSPPGRGAGGEGADTPSTGGSQPTSSDARFPLDSGTPGGSSGSEPTPLFLAGESVPPPATDRRPIPNPYAPTTTNPTGNASGGSPIPLSAGAGGQPGGSPPLIPIGGASADDDKSPFDRTAPRDGQGRGQAGGRDRGRGPAAPPGQYVAPRPDERLELVVACGPAGATIHPGGYKLNRPALEAKDARLVRTLRSIVNARQSAEPDTTVRPEVHFLVEPGGQSTYWAARRQTILAGLGWPISLKVAEASPVRAFAGGPR